MTIRLNGSTSGYVELDAPAVAGTTALTLPSSSGTIARTTDAGLQLITTQTFSAVSSVSVDNCFTASFNNYHVTLNITSLSNTAISLTLRMRASGSDNTGASYNTANVGISTNASAQNSSVGNGTSFSVGGADSGIPIWALSADVFSPQTSTTTSWLGSLNWYNGSIVVGQNVAMNNYQTTSFDGFSLIPSAGTITGTLRIYGYKNS